MSPNRRDALLFAGALAVRAGHVEIVHGGPLFRYLLIDSAFYDTVGSRLAAGEGFPDGVFFMNVLYGAFLGGFYSVFGAEGGGRIAALILQALLGAGAVVLTARIGDVLNRPREGWIAALTLAVFGPAIFYDGALLTPALLLFLTTAAVLTGIRALGGCRKSVLLLGVLLGLLVLGRANNILLLPAFAVLFLRRGRVGVGPVLRITAGVLLCVAPVAVRNWHVSGELVPVTANGGMALWAGNHEGATGIYSEPEFLSNPVPESEAEDYRAEASRRAGRRLTLAESSAYWQKATWSRWTADPGAALRLMGRKLRYWFSATESQTNLSYYFAMEHSWVLRVFRVHMGWILPFAAVGFLLRHREFLVPALPVAVSLATCVLFYMSSEYRHPVVPCLLLFAATGAVHLVATVPLLRRPWAAGSRWFWDSLGCSGSQTSGIRSWKGCTAGGWTTTTSARSRWTPGTWRTPSDSCGAPSPSIRAGRSTGGSSRRCWPEWAGRGKLRKRPRARMLSRGGRPAGPSSGSLRRTGCSRRAISPRPATCSRSWRARAATRPPARSTTRAFAR